MGGKGKKDIIFLVDDDSIYLRSIEYYFKQKLGTRFNIFSFLSGEECINNLHLKPTIIVLDYYLDGTRKEAINGLEVLKTIKSGRYNTNVLMLSISDSLEIANNCIGAGAYDFVIKSETALIKAHNIIENIYKETIIKRRLKSQKLLYLIIISVLILLYISLYIIHKNSPYLFD
ncbi:MAG: response regulator [Bacteroidota bacterium]|nr:response regulator [Bacteroidota bacterium]